MCLRRTRTSTGINWVYDMDTRVPEPAKYTLDDIPSKYSLFDFLINQEQTKISQEMEISVKAAEFVGSIYDALLKQYINASISYAESYQHIEEAMPIKLISSDNKKLTSYIEITSMYF